MFRKIVLLTLLIFGLSLSAIGVLNNRARSLEAEQKKLEAEIFAKQYPVRDLLEKRRNLELRRQLMELSSKRAPRQAELLEAASKLKGLQSVLVGEMGSEFGVVVDSQRIEVVATQIPTSFLNVKGLQQKKPVNGRYSGLLEFP